MRWITLLSPVALSVCLVACTKSPDTKPTERSPASAAAATDAPVSKSAASKAPATAAVPAGPRKIGLPMTCQLGPCHGLENLTCKAGPPMMCTEIYMIGDMCRQYVTCKPSARGCALEADPKFEQCKACVATCKDGACEDACRKKLDGK